MKDKKDWGPADYRADAELKGGCLGIIVVGALVIYGWFSGAWHF